MSRACQRWKLVLVTSDLTQTQMTGIAVFLDFCSKFFPQDMDPTSGIFLGAAGRDGRLEAFLEPTMPHRHRVSPRPLDRLQLGGEPAGVVRTGEIVARLDRHRRAKDGCRPQHRLPVGSGIAALQGVTSDLPVCCRATGEPPTEKLKVLLEPKQQAPETYKAHLPVPVPMQRHARRLRGPPTAEIQDLAAMPPAAQLVHPNFLESLKEPKPRVSHQPQGLLFPCFKSTRRANPAEYRMDFVGVLPS